jgi:hypothetical protein
MTRLKPPAVLSSTAPTRYVSFRWMNVSPDVCVTGAVVQADRISSVTANSVVIFFMPAC